MLFCCWNLWGAPEALCVTEGCRLFQNVAVAGVSLWAVGAGAFAGLLLAALLGLAPLGRCASAFGLALDCALLCVMIAAAPCFNCLIIGLLLALTFLAFRSACGGRSGGRRIGERPRAGHSVSLLFAVWGVLFLLDAGVVAHGLMKTWPLPAGNAAAATRIYFSPSCGACRDLVAASAGAAPDIAWYPVAEREEDLAAIAALLLRTEAGESLPAALESVRAGGILPENPPSVRCLLLSGRHCNCVCGATGRMCWKRDRIDCPLWSSPERRRCCCAESLPPGIFPARRRGREEPWMNPCSESAVSARVKSRVKSRNILRAALCTNS